MDNSITQLLIVAIAIMPFCTGLTQGTKVVFPKLPSRFYPIVAIVIGISLGAISSLITKEYNITQLLISGGIAGMASCGLYDIVITKSKEDSATK